MLIWHWELIFKDILIRAGYRITGRHLIVVLLSVFLPKLYTKVLKTNVFTVGIGFQKRGMTFFPNRPKRPVIEIVNYFGKKHMTETLQKAP